MPKKLVKLKSGRRATISCRCLQLFASEEEVEENTERPTTTIVSNHQLPLSGKGRGENKQKANRP